MCNALCIKNLCQKFNIISKSGKYLKFGKTAYLIFNNSIYGTENNAHK
jgi:hypothetical protein